MFFLQENNPLCDDIIEDMVSIYAEVINLGDPDTEHVEHSENISVKYENP